MEVRMGAFRIHHNSEELMVCQHLGRGGEGTVRGVVLSQAESAVLPLVPGSAPEPLSDQGPRVSCSQVSLIPPQGWQPGGGCGVAAHP